MTCAANPIFMTDASGTIIWINAAFTGLSGYTAADALGRKPSMLKSGRQDAMFYASLWKTILAGEVWQGEVVDRHKDGSAYIIEEVITPLFDRDRKITHFLVIQHDITQQKQRSRHERHLAYHDALTDLPNRALFQDLHRKAVASAGHTARLIATLFLDLDRFRAANDRYGHNLGDRLLGAVGKRLRSAVRATDIVARIGGDEFAVLVTDLATANAVRVLAEKIVASLCRPFVLEGQQVGIGVSVGIAMYPADGNAAEDLLDRADQAMYLAKAAGGATFRFYQDLAVIAPSIAGAPP